MSTLFVAVEDELSLSVVQRIVSYLAIKSELIELGAKQGGYGLIKKRIGRYFELAKRFPVVVLTDLDNYQCPVALRSDWKLQSSWHENLAFCIAVREVEAWLLADRDSFSRYFALKARVLPRVPSDDILDPKGAIIDAIRHSGKAEHRLAILPAEGSRSKVGMGYNRVLSRYVISDWQPEVAAESSSSLARMIERTRSLFEMPRET